MYKKKIDEEFGLFINLESIGEEDKTKKIISRERLKGAS